ncbi:MAG: hypothetical protein HOB00_00325 [Verrucomicrobia bacterium]|nr:hypothetical protein [Verrucomicrobiota bacterium]
MTSSRAIVFDALGQAVAVAQREFPQTYPKPGCHLPPRRPLFPGLPSRQNHPCQRHHCVSRGQRHSSTNRKTQSPIPKQTIIQYC